MLLREQSPLNFKNRNRLRFWRNGITLIEVIVAVFIIGILISLTFPAVQKVRDAAARSRCSNNLRQIGLALHQYNDTQGSLPPGISVNDGRDPQPYLSWNARILPYVEQESLWRGIQQAYDQDKNFLHVPPHSLRSIALTVFSCPNDSRTDQGSGKFIGHPGFTSYLGIEGTDQLSNDGVLFKDSKIRLEEIYDGTSNTLMVGERPPSANEILGWWYAGWGQNQDGSAEMIMGVREINSGIYGANCEVGPYHFKSGKLTNQCDAFHFWSPHIGGGGHFAFCDGSVRFLHYSADSIMPALATRAGGEAVTPPE